MEDFAVFYEIPTLYEEIIIEVEVYLYFVLFLISLFSQNNFGYSILTCYSTKKYCDVILVKLSY